jgi:thiol-disulfide isomerase/thioredoxin
MCASPGFCQPTSEAAQQANETAQPASEAAQRAVQPSGQSSIPEVSLRDTDGNLVELRSLIRPGKPTIISFWATWCAPCKKELSNYAELYADWQKEFDVEVLAISIDDSRNSAKVKSYINGVKWPFRVLLDPNEDMKRALNFQTVPFSLLIDGEGRIAYRHNSYVEGDEYVMEEKLKKLKAVDEK